MTDVLSHFAFPTAVTFGCGAVRQLAEILQARGCRRPFLVTDAGVADQPFFDAIVTQLMGAGWNPPIYTDVHPNPTERDVLQGATKCRAAEADGIVAIGGGSPLDAAKAIALMACVDGTLFEYETRALPSECLPIVAIPTTAGTGSEVGRSSVISENATGIKHILFSPFLLPQHVLADPELTLGLPPAITAATGMDAMTHNIESYLAKDYHPICDGVALEGVRLVTAHLETAVRDGWNIAARSGMMMAAMMGAIAFQKGLGVTHSLAHPLTTVAGVPHGLANAICLPAALAFNRPTVGDRLATLARHSGLADPTPEGFIASVRRLTATIGIPPRLRDVGVTEAMLPRLVDLAVQDTCHQCNPRPVSAADFRRLYEELL